MGVRIVIKGLLALLVIAGMAPFLLPLKDGQPLLKLSEIMLPSLPSVALPLPKETKTAVMLYRWQDHDGNWQFSDAPPDQGVPFETLKVSDELNRTAAAPVVPTPANRDDRSSQQESGAGRMNAYSPEQIRSTLEQAKQVQQLLNERQATQERLLSRP